MFQMTPVGRLKLGNTFDPYIAFKKCSDDFKKEKGFKTSTQNSTFLKFATSEGNIIHNEVLRYENLHYICSSYG